MAVTNFPGNNVFYRKLTISSASFSTSADIFLNFKNGTNGLILSNETSGSILEICYNSNSAAKGIAEGELNYASSTAPLSRVMNFNAFPCSTIWFRVVSGGPVLVRIDAWGK